MTLETGSLVEKSPDQSTWRRFGSMVRHGLIREQDINPSTGEINYTGLRANLKDKKYAKYEEVIAFLETRGPNGYIFRTNQKLRQDKQAWSEIYNDPDINPNVNYTYSVLSTVPEIKEVAPLHVTTEDLKTDPLPPIDETVGAEVPKVLAAAAYNESTEAGMRAFINLKKMIKDVKERYLEYSKGVAAQDLEKQRKGRCYRRQGLSWPILVPETDIYLRKDSLRHGRDWFWRNLKDSFGDVMRPVRVFRPLMRPIAGLLVFSSVVTTHSAASNLDLNWGFNPAGRSGTDESSHIIISDLPPAPVLDVVLPASAAEPIKPEPLAKVEPPAEVMKKVKVPKGSNFSNLLVEAGHPLQWSPGSPGDKRFIDTFKLLVAEYTVNYDEFRKNSNPPLELSELPGLTVIAMREDAQSTMAMQKLADAMGIVIEGDELTVLTRAQVDRITANLAVLTNKVNT